MGDLVLSSQALPWGTSVTEIVFTSFLTSDLVYSLTLNSGRGEASSCVGFTGGTSVKVVERENVKKMQYNPAKLNQARPNMTALMQ